MLLMMVSFTFGIHVFLTNSISGRVNVPLSAKHYEHLHEIHRAKKCQSHLYVCVPLCFVMNTTLWEMAELEYKITALFRPLLNFPAVMKYVDANAVSSTR